MGSASEPCSPRATTTTDSPTTLSWSSGSDQGKRCSATRYRLVRSPTAPRPPAPTSRGCCPKGARRERMGRELGLDATDGYLMLAELGQDCPGAVTFLPAGEVPRRATRLARLARARTNWPKCVKPPPPQLLQSPIAGSGCASPCPAFATSSASSTTRRATAGPGRRPVPRARTWSSPRPANTPNTSPTRCSA